MIVFIYFLLILCAILFPFLFTVSISKLRNGNKSEAFEGFFVLALLVLGYFVICFYVFPPKTIEVDGYTYHVAVEEKPAETVERYGKTYVLETSEQDKGGETK